MTAIAVAAAALVVVLALLALRSSGARRDRRSMQRYGEVLGVLGTISKRSDSVAPVQTPSGDAIARTHVGPHDEPAPRVVDDNAPPPRIRLEAPTAPLSSGRSMPIFGEGELTEEEAARIRASNTSAGALARLVSRARTSRSAPATALSRTVPAPEDDATEAVAVEEAVVVGAATVPLASAKGLRRSPAPASHRGVLGAAAAVVIVAAVVSGVLVSQHPRTSASNPPPRSTGSSKTSSSPPPTTSTTLPPMLSPISVSSSIVTYSLAATSYTVRFTATGDCWLGVQSSVNGSYEWMSTLSVGSSTSYSSRGPFVVRIGAPGAISVTVNGIPVNLPKGRVTPYDISLTAPTTSV